MYRFGSAASLKEAKLYYTPCQVHIYAVVELIFKNIIFLNLLPIKERLFLELIIWFECVN